jgi:hypothetical protein
LAYPRISENSAGYARGIAAPLTRQRISYEFSDLNGIGEMPIRSLVHYITVGESTSTNSSKHLVLRLKSIIAAGEIEVSDLYKTFLDLLL